MTTDEKTKHWDDMPPRKRDAFGAEYIFKRPVKWFPCWRDPECGTLQIQANHPGASDMSEFGGTTEPCYFPEDQGDKYKDDSSFWDVVPNYSTDASADYLILEKVLKLWGENRKWIFVQCLNSIWTERSLQNVQNLSAHSPILIQNMPHLLVKPGDYLKAAWMALNEE